MYCRESTTDGGHVFAATEDTPKELFFCSYRCAEKWSWVRDDIKKIDAMTREMVNEG